MNILPTLLALDRRLALASERLRHQFPESDDLLSRVDNYLGRYAAFYERSIPQLLEAYDGFARQYGEHLKRFRETGHYPCQYSPHEHGDAIAVDRQTYDIALMVSCALVAPRFQILQHLYRVSHTSTQRRIGIVGAGSGLEVEIIAARAPTSSLTAWDLSFSDFVKSQFAPRVLLQEGPFHPDTGDRPFDQLFAIELLEHLSQPLELLVALHGALAPGGQLVCTTATNMPQFDHLTNFTDLPAFKRALEAMGFNILEHRTFKQLYAFEGVEAQNDWFVLEKN